ncbi:type VI secretion system tip protein TssI/VgrG [Microvirga sp. 0TCS3.31]
MTTLRQDKRIASLETPLGSEVLVLTQFEGAEGLSELFEYRVDALSEEENIDFDKALGRNCSVLYRSYDGAERYFNGVLVEAQWVGAKDTHYAYKLVLRPWLWLLSFKTNCRLYSKKTAPDIIKKVFSDAGFNDFRLHLSADYPEMEYCAQYRETDLIFISRLMEQYGIYHYFEHTRDKHTLVLADAKSSHAAIPGPGTIAFIQLAGKDRRDREHIYGWTSERRLRAGKVALNDYDFLQPSASLLSQAQASEKYSRSGFEIYDYPGKYPRNQPEARKKRSDGDWFSKIRLEAEQAADQRRHAAGDAVSLFPGGLISLEQHPSAAENGEHLVVRATHTFGTQYYRSGVSEVSSDVYHGRYELQRSDRPFRAPLVTPKPVIHGVQTALVVGPPGNEIYTDKYGRIKVQFHWDREGTRDEKSSCWIRVAQTVAGRRWGSFQLPRIGQEVVVAFLEGDPDRPLVTGCVYNAEQMPPNELPGGGMITGFKTNSTKGGGGSNSLLADDTKGKELMALHAQYDMDATIRNDLRENVLNDRKRDVKQNETVNVGADQKLKVDANRTVNVGANQTVHVKAMLTETVGINYMENVGAAMQLTVGAAMTHKVGAVYALHVGKASIEVVKGCKRSTITANLTEAVRGNHGRTVKGTYNEAVTKGYTLAAQKFILEAKESFLFDNGKASIRIDSDGNIAIKGKKVKINGTDVALTGSGNVKVKASSDVVIKGSKIGNN